MRLLVKIQLKYSGAARLGVISGFPNRRSQSSLSAEGWVELSPTPAPTVMLIPIPTQQWSPPSVHGHRTSRSQTRERVSVTVWLACGLTHTHTHTRPHTHTHTHTHNRCNKQGTAKVGLSALDLVRCKAEQKQKHVPPALGAFLQYKGQRMTVPAHVPEVDTHTHTHTQKHGPNLTLCPWSCSGGVCSGGFGRCLSTASNRMACIGREAVRQGFSPDQSSLKPQINATCGGQSKGGGGGWMDGWRELSGGNSLGTQALRLCFLAVPASYAS